MRRVFAAVILSALALPAGSLIVGCDETLEENRKVEQRNDGTTVTKEEKVTQSPDGTVTKTEKKEVDPTPAR